MKSWCWTVLLAVASCAPNSPSANGSGEPAEGIVAEPQPSSPEALSESAISEDQSPTLLELPDAAPEAIPVPGTQAIVAERRPPPIHGGTLIALSESEVAISDPARDSVYLVDLDATGDAVRTVGLPQGSQPTRIVSGSNQRLHVVLRGTHQVATLDAATAQLLTLGEPCGLPRGLAHDGKQDRLYVACAGGELVELDGSGSIELRRVQLDRDLKDVVVTSEGVGVSTFRTAELLALDGELALQRRLAPQQSARFFSTATGLQTMSPELAWRTLSTPVAGQTMMLHQRAQDTPLSVAYYGSDCATGIVQATITTFSAQGEPVARAALNDASLSVDVSVNPDNRWLAVASPGSYMAQSSGRRQLLFVSIAELEASVGRSETTTPNCVGTPQMEHVFPGELTSVLFSSETRLLALVREPAQLHVMDFDPATGLAELLRIVDLDPSHVTDSGHLLFHQAPTGGVSCASCHPEGADDGHVWQFSELGARRTQTLQGGVLQRAPFHWNGELPGFNDLMVEIVRNRMLATVPEADVQDTLASWIDGLPSEHLAMVDAEAASRGAVLFASSEVGCADCHRGEDLSSSELYDVGTNTDFLLKAPTLRGIGLRSPLMHDGCAQDMRARFDPTCGGDKHGTVEQLSESELDDLIAFLDSL